MRTEGTKKLNLVVLHTIPLDAAPLLDGTVSITSVVGDEAHDNVGHLPAQN
jgi:hypothetical protein